MRQNSTDFRGVEEGRSRTGHGVADKIRHHLRFTRPVTRSEAEQWVADNKWFGYNPAGYGGRLVKSPGIGAGDRNLTADPTYDGPPCSEWIWEHQASCD